MNATPSRLKLKALLSRLGLDAAVFLHTANMRHLCGFTGSDGVVVAAAEKLVFLTDSRYTTQAQNEVSADAIEEYKNKTDAIVELLDSMQAKRIGYETTLSVGVFEELKEKSGPGNNWVNLKEELHALRLHKSDAELLAITSATERNFTAFQNIVDMIRPGVREDDVALTLEFELRKLGAEEKAFDIIVASGDRGALPHGIASKKIIAEGELVTIDFGCRVSGYFSDETITLAVGEVSDELKMIYQTVLEAHDRAIHAVASGVALTEIDNVARSYIKDCGYGSYFGHGLGHGVGLEVHEAPVVSPRSKTVAEEGMVFTVEPGIYIPGLGGVRIEDMVLVTSNGCRILTKIPKTFRNILLN